MEIHSIGYHHYHDKDFVIDRPDGIGQSWLFLVFKTKTIVRQNGVDTVVLPDSCIIYSGDEPEYYKADDETYIDDWFHFTVEELDIQLFRELALPIGNETKEAPASFLQSHPNSEMIITKDLYEFMLK